MSQVEFRLLGPVEALDRGGLVALGGPRGRAIVAALLLGAGRVVSIDQLVAAAWGDGPPTTARAQVQNRVSRLRRALGSGNGPGLITTSGSGYRIHVGDGQLDLHRFERLVADADARLAAGDGVAAAAALTEALLLWRGPSLDGLGTPPLMAAAQRLEERRVQALEKRIEIDLVADRFTELLPELAALIQAHPYRERLPGYLMLALYRAGRQAEALQVFRQTRAMLAEQLGVEPGPALQRLHEAILRGDEHLAESSAIHLVAPPARVTTSLAPTPTGRTSRAQPVPRQLPTDVPGFTGRVPELEALDALLAGGSERAATALVISAIAGTAGVGKTALAIRWAHRVHSRFPDGQLYVNLRGYDPDQPMTAADALAGFLTALGVPGPDIPLEAGERAARYRTQVADRRMLIVLDNASTDEQVRPLLPGTGSCRVLVTGRDSLAGLVARDGARRIDLDLLDAADAYALLRQLVGPRVDAEPAAATALASLCVRLPLALRVAAELAVSRPTTRLAHLVAELADRQRRLDLLDAGGDPRAALRTVFSWSVQHLPPPAARVFALLGLHPGPDLDAHAAAALAHTSLAQARRELELLTRAHLVHPTTPGRYGMHDLLRAYATELAATTGDTRAALGRLFDYYLAAAATAMNYLHPAEKRRRPRVAAATTPIPALTDPETARVWLDTERPCLLAAAAYAAAYGRPTHTMRLSTTLSRHLAGGHPTDALAIHGHARHGARQTGDLAGEAQALLGIGGVLLPLGRYGPAAAHLQLARDLFRQAGDRSGEARALGNLGAVEVRLGRYEPAADHVRQALNLHRRDGDQDGESWALASLGMVEERRGRYGPAADHYRQALNLFRQDGNATGEARALTNLGMVEERLGRYQLAADHYRQALNGFRQLGNRRGEAHALDNLGTVHTRLGQPEQAAEHHQQALTLFRAAGDRDGEPWALNGLAEAAHATGHHTDALTHHTDALVIAIDTGARDQQARAHTGLGQAHHTLDHPVRAREHYQHALALYTALGTPDADNLRARLAASENATERPT